MNSPVRPRLAPEAILLDATSLELPAFLARHDAAPLLLVCIPPGDTDLELGLLSGAARPADAKLLPFRTALQSHPPPASSVSRKATSEQHARLAKLVAANAYVAVPLRKREDDDATFADRVSVGRAQNKDIVLRHSSISKFHAWFEVDASQAVCVFDSGSTNRTQVNGRAIEPKTSTPISSGDTLQFGGVEAVLCTAEMLWWAFRGTGGGSVVAQ